MCLHLRRELIEGLLVRGYVDGYGSVVVLRCLRRHCWRSLRLGPLSTAIISFSRSEYIIANNFGTRKMVHTPDLVFPGLSWSINRSSYAGAASLGGADRGPIVW